MGACDAALPGIDLVTLAAMLGHSKINMVLRLCSSDTRAPDAGYGEDGTVCSAAGDSGCGAEFAGCIANYSIACRWQNAMEDFMDHAQRVPTSCKKQGPRARAKLLKRIGGAGRDRTDA